MIAKMEDKLFSLLLEQGFGASSSDDSLLAQYQTQIETYVSIDNTLTVLSDFYHNKSYIYAGEFAKIFGLKPSVMAIDSAFEDCIFQRIHKDDLIERHVLELRYFQFQKQQPIVDRSRYSTCCRIRVLQDDGKYHYAIHRTYYLASRPNGAVWLSLCLYTPDYYYPTHFSGIDGRIVDNLGGDILTVDRLKECDQNILSKREVEILQLVARGLGSKQIAGVLNLSVYTVYRHRQNIIQKLNVINTAEAVRTAAIMGLIMRN